MNVLDIYRQYGVHYETEGDRHTTKGWANTSCPFCVGSPGLHLGVHLETLSWRCWRCGRHRGSEALAALCHISIEEAQRLYWSLRPSGEFERARERDRRVQSAVPLSRYTRPSGLIPLNPVQRAYLERRGFDPDEIARTWHVRGTGPYSSLDGVDYRYRLYIPIFWDRKEVSFTTRDTTGRAESKYKACDPSHELVHHKHILYGKPTHWADRCSIIVEGVTDVWRLGPRACAVFGIQYKVEQVSLLARLFDRAAILFDGDDAAQAQARKLSAQLKSAGVRTKILPLERDQDPGSLSEDDAQHLVREVERWK